MGQRRDFESTLGQSYFRHHKIIIVLLIDDTPIQTKTYLPIIHTISFGWSPSSSYISSLSPESSSSMLLWLCARSRSIRKHVRIDRSIGNCAARTIYATDSLDDVGTTNFTRNSHIQFTETRGYLTRVEPKCPTRIKVYRPKTIIPL